MDRVTTFIDIFLAELYEASKLLPRPLESPSTWVKRQRGITRRKYSDTVNYLKRHGLVEISNRNDKKFIKITAKGQLKILLSKTWMERPTVWDGKWRIIMFDIPEGGKNQRFRLRRLLREQGFIRLQDSVYIHPYPLSRSGLEYLKVSGLIDYVRMLKVEDMDDDGDLQKKFHLR